ncbi:FAD-dependent oxidoreductase [Kocuria aegyptia]|uniref:FAD-binding domain-containing protein n=1 Tax=Kocuria aegyptia TaxID=330943 RepID=A0ABP4X7G2_9MICC
MRAVVCGAGVTGLALAGCLGRQGWDVVVLERAPDPREQGCMLDFFGPGWDAAEAMGVLPAVLELGCTVERLSSVDDRGRDRAGLPFARFARALDGRLVSVLRPDLERVLREHARDVAELRFGQRVVGVRQRPGGADAVLDDGTVLGADLVVGADSAQAVSLLGGQGASPGIAGAWLLAERLARAASVEDAVAGCERVWRPVVTEKQRLARGGAQWFLPSSRARRPARRLAALPGLDGVVTRGLVGAPGETSTPSPPPEPSGAPEPARVAGSGHEKAPHRRFRW